MMYSLYFILVWKQSTINFKKKKLDEQNSKDMSMAPFAPSQDSPTYESRPFCIHMFADISHHISLEVL